MTEIYLITNCYGDSNKVYIGKTVNLIKRSFSHKINFGKNIDISVIDNVNSFNRKDWKPLECFWISYFKFLGFDVQNKNGGGNGVEFHSEESKLKISKTHLGRKQSQETKDKKRLANKGRPKPKGFGLGKIISYNTKQKMSKAHLGKAHSDIIKQKMSKAHFTARKPINQYDLNGTFIKEWESITEISESLKKQGAAISECCNGLRKTAYKNIWKFKQIKK